jgi:N-acetylmuramoyl-L-alanine amidase
VATLAPDAAEEKPAPVRPLSALVEEHSGTKTADSEMECLAGAIYFESKGEPLAGQLAVAEVVINRAKSGRYPASLCGVVKQRGQFSFIRAGRFPAFSRDNAHWRKAVAIAHIAMKDLADSPAAKALAFHATRVSPGWRMKRVARVGNHVFYR